MTQREQFSDTGAQTGSVQRNLSFVDFTGLIAVYFISSCKMSQTDLTQPHWQVLKKNTTESAVKYTLLSFTQWWKNYEEWQNWLIAATFNLH